VQYFVDVLLTKETTKKPNISIKESLNNSTEEIQEDKGIEDNTQQQKTDKN